MCALENREIRPRTHVIDRRHAVRVRVCHRRVKSAIELRRRRIRNRPIDQVLRIVLEDSGRLSGRVANNGAARNVSTRHRDFGGAQRSGVGERHVSIQAADPHRIIRRNGINP